MGRAYLVFKCFIYRSMNRFRVEEAATSRRMAYGSHFWVHFNPNLGRRSYLEYPV